jgi:hypothetical protein
MAEAKDGRCSKADDLGVPAHAGKREHSGQSALPEKKVKWKSTTFTKGGLRYFWCLLSAVKPARQRFDATPDFLPIPFSEFDRR